jgi:hypothetical protein
MKKQLLNYQQKEKHKIVYIKWSRGMASIFCKFRFGMSLKKMKNITYLNKHTKYLDTPDDLFLINNGSLKN